MTHWHTDIATNRQPVCRDADRPQRLTWGSGEIKRSAYGVGECGLLRGKQVADVAAERRLEHGGDVLQLTTPT